MKKRSLSLLLSAAMLAATLSGCGGSTQSASSAAASSAAPASSAAASSAAASSEAASSGAAAASNGKVVKIGVISSMTGGSAIYGQGAQNSINMAVEEINAGGGTHVQILNGGKVVDDGGDSKQAVNAYNSLAPEKPDAIVGAFFSSVTLPMAQLAKQQNMLLLATGATNVKVTQVGPTIFRDCFIDPYQGKMAAKFAQEQGVKKIAVVYAKDDDYSNGLKDAFVQNAQANGMQIVYTGACTTKDTDFTAQASQVVQSGADFLYYPCFLDTVPLLVEQAREAGFSGKIMGGDGWDGSNTAGHEASFKDCYFTNHYSNEDTAPAVVKFVTKYKQKYGDKSLNACAALYYDAIYMLKKAADDTGATDTASLVKGMTGMKFTGVGGTFTLDADRNAVKSVVINTYDNGKVKWLKTIAP